MRKPVLTIFYQYDPWNATIGGIQTIIGSCLKYAPEDFRLRVVGITSDRTLKTGVWHENQLKGREVLFMPLFYIEDDNRRHWIPTTLRYTLALMKKHLASDFMHFHRLEPGLAALRWSGKKTLFVHNDIHRQVMSTRQPGDKQETAGILWRKLPQAYLALERFLLPGFSQILSCNSESKQFYCDRYPDLAHRVALVRNTVDNDLFKPLPPEIEETTRYAFSQRLGLPLNTQYILFAGRLHPQKDPLLLIQSLAQIRIPHVHLLIAGDGELREAAEAEAQRLGVASAVSFLGAVPQEELIQLHQIAQVCALTSQYEGLPLVVLEALACGTPVVSTRCGETPKLLSEKSGIVCDERTPEAIAHALSQVLEHPELYPASACVLDAKPYQAKQVVGELYEQMWLQWKTHLPS